MATIVTSDSVTLEFGYATARIQAARADRLERERAAREEYNELERYLHAPLVEDDPLSLTFDLLAWWMVRNFFNLSGGHTLKLVRLEYT